MKSETEKTEKVPEILNLGCICKSPMLIRTMAEIPLSSVLHYIQRRRSSGGGGGERGLSPLIVLHTVFF